MNDPLVYVYMLSSESQESTVHSVGVDTKFLSLFLRNVVEGF